MWKTTTTSLTLERSFVSIQPRMAFYNEYESCVGTSKTWYYMFVTFCTPNQWSSIAAVGILPLVDAVVNHHPSFEPFVSIQSFRQKFYCINLVVASFYNYWSSHTRLQCVNENQSIDINGAVCVCVFLISYPPWYWYWCLSMRVVFGEIISTESKHSLWDKNC